jgi:hypothetical protein
LAREQLVTILNVLGLTRPIRAGLELTTSRMLCGSTKNRLPQPLHLDIEQLQCKTNTMTILLHQMRILTDQVFSVMLRPKKLESWINCENYKRAGKKPKECYEIEPNPSKDRAMYDGILQSVRVLLPRWLYHYGEYKYSTKWRSNIPNFEKC